MILCSCLLRSSRARFKGELRSVSSQDVRICISNSILRSREDDDDLIHEELFTISFYHFLIRNWACSLLSGPKLGVELFSSDKNL